MGKLSIHQGPIYKNGRSVNYCVFLIFRLVIKYILFAGIKELKASFGQIVQSIGSIDVAVKEIKEATTSFRDSIIALRIMSHCLPSEVTVRLEHADSNMLQTTGTAKELLASAGIDFGEDNWL